MDRRCAKQTRPRWVSIAAASFAAIGMIGCSTVGPRAVVDVRPRITSAEWGKTVSVSLERGGSADGSPELVAEIEAARDAAKEAMVRSFQLEVASALIQDASAPTSSELLGEGPAQLDPGLGPVDLGYPLLVDLGAGDAPYDDGVETIHAEESKRGGFSDTVIQLQWRHRMGPEMSFHGGASMFRYQDLGILDGLSDARFGWAVLGIQFRF